MNLRVCSSIALMRWMSYCVTRVIDTPFRPAQQEEDVIKQMVQFWIYICYSNPIRCTPAASKCCLHCCFCNGSTLYPITCIFFFNNQAAPKWNKCTAAIADVMSHQIWYILAHWFFKWWVTLTTQKWAAGLLNKFIGHLVWLTPTLTQCL